MPVRSVVFGPSGFAPTSLVVGPDPFDPTVGDGLGPATPTGLTLSDSVYEITPGREAVQVLADWAPVELNTDGTVLDDLAGYELTWRFAGGSWSASGRVDAVLTEAVITALPVGSVIDVRVRAVDTSANHSGWATVAGHVCTHDTLPPGVPSTPAVTSLFGGIRITWDGQSATGAAMPLDFNRVAVYLGPNDVGFDVAAATLVDVITSPNGGTAIALRTDYGVNHRVKLVAYDNHGNASDPSAASAAVAARQGVEADFASVSASSITAGRLSADVGLAGRLLIGALNPDGSLVNPAGPRLELTDNGIAAYVAGATPFFDVDVAAHTLTLRGGAVIAPLFETAEGLAVGGSVQGMMFDPAVRNRLKFFSGRSAETGYGYLSVDDLTVTSGVFQGQVFLTPSAYGHGRPYLKMVSASNNGVYLSFSELGGDLNVTGELTVGGGTTLDGGHVWVTTAYIDNIARQFASTLDINNDAAVTTRFSVNNPFAGHVFDAAAAGGRPLHRPPSGGPNSAIRWGDTAILVRNAADTAYTDIHATSFIVESSAAVKDNLARHSGADLLAVVRGAPAYAWHYKTDLDPVVLAPDSDAQRPEATTLTGGRPAAPPGRTVSTNRRGDTAWMTAKQHHGPLAEDLPAAFKAGPSEGTGVDTTDVRDLLGVLWGAVDYLAGRVDALSPGRKP